MADGLAPILASVSNQMTRESNSYSSIIECLQRIVPASLQPSFGSMLKKSARTVLTSNSTKDGTVDSTHAVQGKYNERHSCSSETFTDFRKSVKKCSVLVGEGPPGGGFKRPLGFECSTGRTLASLSAADKENEQPSENALSQNSKRARTLLEKAQGSVRTEDAKSINTNPLHRLSCVDLRVKTGRSTTTTVDSVDKKSRTKSMLSCAICTEAVENPYAARCGHICCRLCWEKVLQCGALCPLCRKPTSAVELTLVVVRE